MWREGWFSRQEEIKKARNPDGKRPVDRHNKLGKILKDDSIIMTKDIPGYFTEENMFFINFWKRVKNFGNPWGCGWTEWPWWAVPVVELLDYANEVLGGK